MPSLTLHLVFAERALSAAKEADQPTLRALSSHPVLTEAFRQGALGPDLGYFPGGDRFLSDLAHCIRTADLNRAILGEARTDEERAFALGWLTHVLADRLVHPAIGRATGELLFGTRELFVDGGMEPVAHVRIETGLDAHFAAGESSRMRSPRTRFGLSSLRFIARAYRSTYDISMDFRSLARSYQALLRLAAPGLGIIRAFGARYRGALEDPSNEASHRARGGLRRLLPLSLAFLSPVPPAPWLISHVEAVLARFPDEFLGFARNGLSDLQNANLETGEPEEIVRNHSTTTVTRARLRRVTRAEAIPGQVRSRLQITG